MENKKNGKKEAPEDLRGFEEFLEDLSQEKPFLPRGVGGGTKKEVSFEHFTFLTNDNDRLNNLKQLLSTKVPFSRKFEQGKKIIEEENEEISQLRSRLFEVQDEPNSRYRTSLKEIFQNYFGTI